MIDEYVSKLVQRANYDIYPGVCLIALREGKETMTFAKRAGWLEAIKEMCQSSDEFPVCGGLVPVCEYDEGRMMAAIGFHYSPNNLQLRAVLAVMLENPPPPYKVMEELMCGMTTHLVAGFAAESEGVQTKHKKG